MIQGIFLNYLIKGYWALWVLHCLKDVMRCESVAHQQCREKGAEVVALGWFIIPHHMEGAWYRGGHRQACSLQERFSLPSNSTSGTSSGTFWASGF